MQYYSTSFDGVFFSSGENNTSYVQNSARLSAVHQYVSVCLSLLLFVLELAGVACGATPSDVYYCSQTLHKGLRTNRNVRIVQSTVWKTTLSQRYERMTRGRRREHYQWNMDIWGVDGVEAEAELLGAIVTFLERVGLGPEDVGIKVIQVSCFFLCVEPSLVVSSLVAARFSQFCVCWEGSWRGVFPDFACCDRYPVSFRSTLGLP